VAVFGIPERDSRDYTVVVPDCKKEALMAKITAATVKGSVFYTDEFTSYSDLSRYGKHIPSNTGSSSPAARRTSTGSRAPGAMPSGCIGSATAWTRGLPVVPRRVRIPVQSSRRSSARHPVRQALQARTHQGTLALETP
jgi:transposase-like protein